VARRRLLRLCRASGCLGTACGSSRRSSSTSTTPHVRVPRHVARLVTRLVVDYFDYVTRLGALARRAARRTARRTAHRQLRLHRASGCLGMSRGLSSTSSHTPRVRVPRHIVRLVVDYFASRRLVVDYFAYAARPGASARRAARRRLHRLCCASGCLGTSRGSSSTTSPRAGSSSTTSPMSCVRVPRHVTRLVVDYFACAARPGASTCRAARLAACRRLVRAPRMCLAATLALLQPRRVSRLLVSRQHQLYFEYAAHRCDMVFRSHRVDHSSRLVFQTSRERQSRPQQLVRINSD
jgi:hypothetical protein